MMMTNNLMERIETWLVLSDQQVPYHDTKALDAVEQYMATLTLAGIINIGDFLDMETISSFSEGRPRLIEGKYISADIAEANKILDRHIGIARKKNPKARYVYLQGNHEHRIERFLDEHPQFQGLLDIEHLLKFKERGIEWIRSWEKGEIFALGKAHFTHGQATGQYHAKKMVEDYGDSIFYGHVHDIMCIPKANKTHPEKVIVGQSIGCLCIRDMPYMQGRPSKWQQGFAVFFFMPDGTYTYYTPRIFNGQFVGPDGVLYKGYAPTKPRLDPVFAPTTNAKCQHINSYIKTRIKLGSGRIRVRKWCRDCKHGFSIYE